MFNSIEYEVVCFFNIVFLLSIKLFVFYMLKINILIISRKQFVYLYSYDKMKNIYIKYVYLNILIKK